MDNQPTQKTETTEQAQAPQQAPSTLQKPPRDNKKVLIVVASVVGFLVLVGIVVAILMAVFAVSKKDYRAAITQYNKIADADSSLDATMSTMSYSMSSSSDVTFDKDVSSARSAIKELRNENTALSQLKAVKSGEGKKQYKKFNDKVASYTDYANNAVTSLDDARTALLACKKASTSSSDAVSAKKAADMCVSELKKVKNTPNSDIREYLKTYQAQMEKMSDLAGKMAAITDPYGDQYNEYSSIRDQIYDVEDEVSDAGSDLQDNLEKHSKEVDPKSAANDFVTFLESKAK